MGKTVTITSKEVTPTGVPLSVAVTVNVCVPMFVEDATKLPKIPGAFPPVTVYVHPGADVDVTAMVWLVSGPKKSKSKSHVPP